MNKENKQKVFGVLNGGRVLKQILEIEHNPLLDWSHIPDDITDKMLDWLENAQHCIKINSYTGIIDTCSNENYIWNKASEYTNLEDRPVAIAQACVFVFNQLKDK